MLDRSILNGIYDLHIHTGPSVAKRLLDAGEMMKNAQAAGEPASVILELIQDALAFAKINKNRLLINELNQMKKQL